MQIQVDPARLEHHALRIEQESVTYEKQYSRLYQEVEEMGNNWQGKDNLAFVTQIKSFQIEFQKMATLMREYANFLKLSAKTYRQTQDERVASARSLLR